MLDMGDAGRLGGDGTGHLRGVVDEQLREPLGENAAQVLQHPWDADLANSRERRYCM